MIVFDYSESGVCLVKYFSYYGYMQLDEAFWKIHEGLPRQAPGSDVTTQTLYNLAGKPKGKALDIGCGPGRSALVLAKHGMHVTAVDTYQLFWMN